MPDVLTNNIVHCVLTDNNNEVSQERSDKSCQHSLSLCLKVASLFGPVLETIYGKVCIISFAL